MPGSVSGPTSVMRIEHEQIRSLLEELSRALESKDDDRILAIGETLNILIQQHNLKEENMLYPMSDAHLKDKKKELLQKMQSLATQGNHGTSPLE